MWLILVRFGTVGRGVAESLLGADSGLSAAGFELRVVAVVDPVVGAVRCEGGFDLATLLGLADAGEPLTDHPGAAPLAGLGVVTITGPGAGRRATGHAVVADLLAVHRSVM